MSQILKWERQTAEDPVSVTAAAQTIRTETHLEKLSPAVKTHSWWQLPHSILHYLITETSGTQFIPAVT